MGDRTSGDDLIDGLFVRAILEAPYFDVLEPKREEIIKKLQGLVFENVLSGYFRGIDITKPVESRKRLIIYMSNIAIAVIRDVTDLFTIISSNYLYFTIVNAFFKEFYHDPEVRQFLDLALFALASMETFQSEPVKEFWLRMHRKPLKTYASRIVQYIQEEKNEFAWQPLCKLLSRDTTESLRGFAKEYKIKGYTKMTKRELCKALATYTFKKPRNCQNDTTILGDEISSIPDHLLYAVEENGKTFCFNILEIINMSKNPYTNKPFDLQEITKRYQFIRKITGDLDSKEILRNIRENPILSQKQLIGVQINNILVKLKYPPPRDKILGINNKQLSNLVQALRENPVTGKFIRGQINSIADLVPSMLSIVNSTEDTAVVALEFYLNEIFNEGPRNS